MRFAGGEEYRDLLHLGVDRALEPAGIRTQCAEAHAPWASNVLSQSVRVGELRDPAGRHVTSDFDVAQPRSYQRLDQQLLLTDVDQLRFVLQTIARGDLVDRDPVDSGRHQISSKRICR